MAATPPVRSRFRVPALAQAVLVLIGAWLVFDHAFPPVMPRALMIQFMAITAVGVLLYFSFEDERWEEFKAPLAAVVTRPGLWPIRWLLILCLPVLAGWLAWDAVRPRLEAPVELRQVHPAPPSALNVYGERFDLSTLENPLRNEVLALLDTDPGGARERYDEVVARGSEIYYQNCFYCHGDRLEGEGPFARAFNPLPANFRDVGTIAQLQEGFLFWRITTGGPGLPKEGAPWNSAMPVWHEMLDLEEVWSVITFLYDDVEQVPRMWDQETSRKVTAVRDRIADERKALEGEALYARRCVVCHGEDGAGDGPAADFLYPRPRDFTLGLYKYKTSPGTVPARDQDLFDTIKFGLDGTGMPAWAGLLNDEQIRSLVPVIKRLDITAAFAPEEAPDEAFDDDGRYTGDSLLAFDAVEPVDGRVAYAPESVARGKVVFDKACAECHGDAGRGNITSGKRLEDDWGYRIWPRNLTAPWTWRVSEIDTGDPSDRDATIGRIYERLSIGIPGTPMPAHRAEEEGNEDPVSLEDRWHVANYVYSLREDAAPAPGAEPLIVGRRVDGDLPAGDDDEAWLSAPVVTVPLAPNMIKDERLFTPLVGAISVRVLYNDSEIALRLEVDDRTDSRPGEPVSEQIQDESLELHPDAVAVQFPREGAYVAEPVVEKPLYRHGDRSHPTTIWYYNAGSVEPAVPARATLLDANGPDQALSPRPEAGLAASGRWEHGRWRIVMRRARDPGQSGDVRFDEGRFIPVSFASWDGSNGEVGSRHTLTSWYWLLLPPEPDLAAMYATPGAAAGLAFIAGLWLFRRRRPGAGDRGAGD